MFRVLGFLQPGPKSDNIVGLLKPLRFDKSRSQDPVPVHRGLASLNRLDIVLHRCSTGLHRG